MHLSQIRKKKKSQSGFPDKIKTNYFANLNNRQKGAPIDKKKKLKKTAVGQKSRKLSRDRLSRKKRKKLWDSDVRCPTGCRWMCWMCHDNPACLILENEASAVKAFLFHVVSRQLQQWENVSIFKCFIVCDKQMCNWRQEKCDMALEPCFKCKSNLIELMENSSPGKIKSSMKYF